MNNRIKLFAASALMALASFASGAQAVDITVLSAAAVEVPVRELARQFQEKSGHAVKFEFSTAGGVENKVRSGFAPDLVINSAERLKALATSGRISPGSIKPLGQVRIGVAVRDGGVRPDLRSAQAFSASLMRAESVAYGNPEKGATTGIHFAKVIGRLGLTEAMKSKSILADNGLHVMRLVASGNAELGITQISEIRHIKSDALVGPLPDELQLVSTYSVAPGKKDSTDAARQFMAWLLSAAGRERFRHAGFE